MPAKIPEMKPVELPMSVSIPSENEFVLPVYSESDRQVVRKIKMKDLIEHIEKYVTDGGQILITYTENGVKFNKLL